MTGRRRGTAGAWRRGLTPALLVLLLAALPAAADAKKKAKPGKLQTASASVTSSANGEVVTATATCPAGTTVIGGGFASGTSTEAGAISDSHTITESRRASKTSWVVGGYRADSGAAGPALPLSAEAYCRKNAGKISEVSDTDSAPSTTSFLSAGAACPLGRAAVGGGFKVVPPGTIGLPFLLLAHRPLGVVGWTGSGIGAMPAAPNSLTEYAYCRKGSTKVAARSAAGTLPLGTAGAVGSVTTPSCPAKKFPFVGGFRGPAFSTGVGLPFVTESRRSGGAWTVSGFTFGPVLATVTAYGTCS